jgi:electron transport complex protein RnfE
MKEKETVSNLVQTDNQSAKAKDQTSPLRLLLNGILDENPVFRLVLGTCPLLAVTTSAKNAVSMGLAVIFVQAGSEVIISLMRKIIPDKVRIPAFITIIAGFVTIVQMLVSAYLPALNDSLGIYIPLIVVNCIVLARAEAFASKKTVVASLFDGIGMGAGFTVALFLMGSIREILGNGTFFDMQLPLFGTVIKPIMFFILPPGGFFVFGICIWMSQLFMKRIKPKKDDDKIADTDIGGKSCDSCGSCSACPGAVKSEGGKV